MHTVLQISKSMKIDRGIAQQGLDDHYAVLGVPITATPLQVRDRYLTIAKKLHPDVSNLSPEEREVGNRYFARMVNPAYFALNKARERAEYSNVMKLVAKRMIKRAQKVVIYSDIAKALAKAPTQENYEKAVRMVAAVQYQKIGRILDHAGDISELNLVYLLAKEGCTHLIERGDEETKLQTAPPQQQWQTVKSKGDDTRVQLPDTRIQKAIPAPAAPINRGDFAMHMQRAEVAIKRQEWSIALKELKQALKLNNRDSRCHALIGLVYLNQKLPGMAKSAFEEALKCNPREPIALQYLPQVSRTKDTKPQEQKKNLPGWLSWLRGGN
ncbi:MAG: DnaJ domain-containing protein [Pseudanabaenaceae cyanobacterium]